MEGFDHEAMKKYAEEKAAEFREAAKKARVIYFHHLVY